LAEREKDEMNLGAEENLEEEVKEDLQEIETIDMLLLRDEENMDEVAASVEREKVDLEDLLLTIEAAENLHDVKSVLLMLLNRDLLHRPLNLNLLQLLPRLKEATGRQNLPRRDQILLEEPDPETRDLVLLRETIDLQNLPRRQKTDLLLLQRTVRMKKTMDSLLSLEAERAKPFANHECECCFVLLINN
jgi:hypothetical protein